MCIRDRCAFEQMTSTAFCILIATFVLLSSASSASFIDSMIKTSTNFMRSPSRSSGLIRISSNNTNQSVTANVLEKSFIHISNVQKSLFFSLRLFDASLDAANSIISVSFRVQTQIFETLRQILDDEVAHTVYSLQKTSEDSSTVVSRISFDLKQAKQVKYTPMSWIAPNKLLWQFGLRFPSTGNIGVGLDLYPSNAKDEDAQIFQQIIRSVQTVLYLATWRTWLAGY
eukprot:TRINITY_DN7182_c0_g1_i11.p2 TRINITY_DN7182_c0_g1~~TRINITY_DN7182_c0_g1_i11.p2  ORF type:complete len:261 (-),score=39.15 TRINITY_DN7182_c0_g1_i11:1906-2589(-)